jgi:hypothetical protein
MSFREKDYLKRQLEEAARAVARILGFHAAGRTDQARAELEKSARSLIGVGMDPLGRVDIATAAGLLRSSAAVETYAQLLEAQAALDDDPALLARAKAIRET